MLFEANWFYIKAPLQADVTGWEQITTPEQLAQWETQWKASGSSTERQMFLPALLENKTISFWGRRSGNSYDAGFIGNRTGRSTGLSNFFAPDMSGHLAAQMATLLQRWSGVLPVLGYAHGPFLKAVLSVGFERLGNLTLWFKSHSESGSFQ
ncbi:hypothetical protein [Pseudovibrio sp. Tun.PSC04-5.I4]|uniref:hypothetical protein n=1 Tax=Pseudovibrio sp. Tun.PSC04-5.I4 TaxID=1798213 RepID=UPI001AD923E0|nr:hypothetical protein [Pseudovibrio sp. Tun.PSC04-5.I4]